jgi:hypothetical protein
VKTVKIKWYHSLFNRNTNYFLPYGW